MQALADRQMGVNVYAELGMPTVRSILSSRQFNSHAAASICVAIVHVRQLAEPFRKSLTEAIWWFAYQCRFDDHFDDSVRSLQWHYRYKRGSKVSTCSCVAARRPVCGWGFVAGYTSGSELLISLWVCPHHVSSEFVALTVRAGCGFDGRSTSGTGLDASLSDLLEGHFAVPGILAAGLLAFALSIDDFIITFSRWFKRLTFPCNLARGSGFATINVLDR